MKNRILALAALMMFVTGAAQAAEVAVSANPASGGNFVAGNKNNDGKYTPRKVRQTRVKDPNRQPGFWGKEWKRSGLSEMGGTAKWTPFSDAGKFLKEKDEAVRAKHSTAATAATATTATTATTAASQ